MMARIIEHFKVRKIAKRGEGLISAISSNNVKQLPTNSHEPLFKLLLELKGSKVNWGIINPKLGDWINGSTKESVYCSTQEQIKEVLALLERAGVAKLKREE